MDLKKLYKGCRDYKRINKQLSTTVHNRLMLIYNLVDKNKNIKVVKKLRKLSLENK